ncbi:DNA-binding protein, partial [Bartonella sp. AP152HLJHH]|uniref:DNA-binding protein n=1 Tax=Bartonella sp. AP152HLJHH TaxID=3243469 RepID=UPI0035D04FF8
MKEWFTIAELAEAALPGLPKSKGGLRKILSTKWRHQSGLTRKVKGVSRPIVEVHISLLPEGARAALLVRFGGVCVEEKTEKSDQKTSIWVRYEGLSKAHKRRCEERLKA